MYQSIPKFNAKEKNGHIINVASLAASFGIPGLAAYCGSKFAMLGFSESLQHELHGTGVHVTVVSPIGVKTNFSTIHLLAISSKIRSVFIWTLMMWLEQS